MTLCLSNYGDKCCKLYVLMFGLWLFSRFTPPLRLPCWNDFREILDITVVGRSLYIVVAAWMNAYSLALFHALAMTRPLPSAESR